VNLRSVAPAHVLLDETDSTNAEARRRALAGERGPLWIAARRQSAGKGRRGRSWEGGGGNLHATLLLTTDRSAGEAAQLSFVAALAVCDLARAYVDPAKARVKWPNDLMIGDAKAAGILLESGPAPGGGLWVAVGIGVNLAYAPQNVDRPATRFADHAASVPDVATALQGLAFAFAEWQAVWEAQGFDAIARAWTSRAYRLGEPAQARLANETVSGVAEGLDADGALSLRLNDGTVRKISAGDVFFGEG
jgi:BirA family biotin operon repressor/biotin-[acetyl-CoA-carboxylase] ligase